MNDGKVRRDARQFWAILRKDLLLEVRSKEIFTSTFLFSVMALVIFHFAFSPNLKDMSLVAAGMLWVAVLFTSILGLNRSFVHEKDEECLDGLLLTPIDRPVIFVAKFAGNLIYLVILQVIVVPIFVMFFLGGASGAVLLKLAMVLALGDLGMASVGTVLATISANTRARDLLLPILYLPVMTPFMMQVVSYTNGVLVGGRAAEDMASWLYLIIGFDIMFLLIGYALYDFVIGE
jgi:heme exporter protein B